MANRRGARTLVALALGAVLLAATVGAAGGRASGAGPKFTARPLSPASTFAGVKTASGAIAQTDPSLLGRTDSTPVNVMIKYDYDATASYTGGVGGLAPTSPSVTGVSLKDNQRAVQAYDRHAGELSSKITSAVTDAVPSAKIGETFNTAYGGVAARVPADKIGDLLKVNGVVAVQRDSLEQPESEVTPQFTGATNAWPSLGGSVHAAENVVVGVIDTGIWPESPFFADRGLPAPPAGGPYACQFGDGSDTAHLGQPFACNRKLIGAYAFTDTYMANLGSDGHEFCNDATRICSARDPTGHGTHTSSTAAGDVVDSAPLNGVDRGPVSGIAPGARLIMYRACLAKGCFSSDSVRAVQQAILDGVDVINYSISGGADPYTDSVELAFLDAFHAGISVNASAGNGGPDAGTIEHGGPWVTTVGASTSNAFFTSSLRLTADGGATLERPGVTIAGGVSGATPVVLAENIPGEDKLCQAKLAPGSAAAGKIVACERGTNPRLDKGFNVLSGGAAGMILYNPVAQDVETDEHWLPAIHVDGPSAPLLAFIGGHTNVKASWAQGVESPTKSDVMATFSARGPESDFIKPDLTAPGIQVLGGMTPQPDETTASNGPPGNLFQALSGTSMSSPHAAGAAALVKAAHPEWTPGEIKSALMTSAAQGVVKEDGVTPADPFDDGAGSLRVDAAVRPTLVFDETYDHYAASALDPLHRLDLNLPSVDAPTMTGTITTRRTAINVSGRDQELAVSTSAPAGVSIVVSDRAPGKNGAKADSRIHLRRNRPTQLWITISAPALPDGQYFGRITLTPSRDGSSPVTIPVAFDRRQGLVTLAHVCDASSFTQKTGRAHCIAKLSNLASAPAHAGLTVTNVDRGRGLDFTNITAPASSIRRDDGVQWNGTLSPTVPPQVTSIAPTVGPAGGYLPLSAFGIPPIPGVGDDTISNFDLPDPLALMYGGEPYTELGVVSNGYLVLGGGDVLDVLPAPQTFPDPNRPNNVIAPFWSDLNPAAGPAGSGVRIAILSDNAPAPATQSWLVVDWSNVPNFTPSSTTHSFEVWIRLGTTPESEQVTMSYGATGAGDPAGVNWGAENRDGSSGRNIPAPGPAGGSEYLVRLTPPKAGGSVTIGYDASSRKAGTYSAIAAMTSDVTPGTTQVVRTFTVTR